ncbi:MAG TPA: serine O-acetyltransferase EpsC [Tepidisphaeraceae bacterium]|jgi:serine O-acetyltransferase|nr:serine O-acetyltransferase EpsC [Tepidisphaeraceae bacterium]
MDRNNLNQRLPAIVQSIVASIHAQSTMQHLNRALLPNRDEIVSAIGLLQQLAFPGYFGKQGLTEENAGFRVGELVMELSEVLFDQVRCCLRHREPCPENPTPAEAAECDAEAARIVGEFFDRIPAVRALLATDVQAAFDSDPAATSTDETIFSYPGLYAIFVQRMAHEFYKLSVPLLPRIMTEHAHSRTGIDIHPGARLGNKMFIDHGTGVVIGQTCVIGENVKIYQGVTLGALAPAYGQLLRGQKRHPTIEDDVVIYAGATILGGETVIGKGSVIGGNVFITSSVPPHNIVSAEPPKLKYRERRRKSSRGPESANLDFQI